MGRQRDHAEIERLVRDVNAAVLRVNTEAPSTRQHRRPLVLAEELAAYDAACDG